MSEDAPPNSKSSSLSLAVEKARALRVERLVASLEKRLDQPVPAIDALMAEAAEGAPHPELWEKLHFVAARDGVEASVADAYLKALEGARMRRLTPQVQADVLVHAADFSQGMRGDHETAERLLWRALEHVPDRADVFARLEKRLEKAPDERRLVELYALVAATPPREVKVLATQTLNRLLLLKRPLADDACRKLLALVSTNPRVLDAVDAHCRATKRPKLACELLERAVAEDTGASDAITRPRRLRLVELHLGDVATPAAAIDHVEWLLERDPNDAASLKAGERLLGERAVASRAAAALQKARRARTG